MLIKSGQNLLIYHQCTISQNGRNSTNFWFPLFPQQESKALGRSAWQGRVKQLCRCCLVWMSLTGCCCCSYPSGRQLRSQEIIVFQKYQFPIFPKGISAGILPILLPCFGRVYVWLSFCWINKQIFQENWTIIAEVRVYIVARHIASAIIAINTSFQKLNREYWDSVQVSTQLRRWNRYS